MTELTRREILNEIESDNLENLPINHIIFGAYNNNVECQRLIEDKIKKLDRQLHRFFISKDSLRSFYKSSFDDTVIYVNYYIGSEKLEELIKESKLYNDLLDKVKQNGIKISSNKTLIGNNEILFMRNIYDEIILRNIFLSLNNIKVYYSNVLDFIQVHQYIGTDSLLNFTDRSRICEELKKLLDVTDVETDNYDLISYYTKICV